MKFATPVSALGLLLVVNKTVHAFIDVTPVHLIVAMGALISLIIYNGEIPAPPLFLKQPILPPSVTETVRIEGVTLQVADSLADLLLASPAQLLSLTDDLPTPSNLSTILSRLQLIFKFLSPLIFFTIASSLQLLFKFLSPLVLFGFVTLLLLRGFNAVKGLGTSVSVRLATLPWDTLLQLLNFCALVYLIHLTKKHFTRIEQELRRVREDINDARNLFSNALSRFENVLSRLESVLPTLENVLPTLENVLPTLENVLPTLENVLLQGKPFVENAAAREPNPEVARPATTAPEAAGSRGWY